MKKNIWIIVLAFFLAIFIWIEIKLVKVQQENIQIPISIKNAPTTLIPLSITPETINMRIEGKGNNLLKYYFSKYSYYIDLKNVHYGKNYIPFNYETMQIFDEYNLRIIHQPSFKNFLVVMDNMTSKRVPIRVIFTDKESKDFFENNNFHLSPNTINVEGPKILLSEIFEIETLPFNLKKHDINSTLKLIPPKDKLINIERESAKIIKKKLMISEKTISFLPISVSENIEIFPKFVSIKIKAYEDILQELSSEDFKAMIDTNYQIKIGNKVPIIIEVPQNIQLQEKTPEEVKIIDIKG